MGTRLQAVPTFSPLIPLQRGSNIFPFRGDPGALWGRKDAQAHLEVGLKARTHSEPLPGHASHPCGRHSYTTSISLPWMDELLVANMLWCEHSWSISVPVDSPRPPGTSAAYRTLIRIQDTGLAATPKAWRSGLSTC